MITRSKRKRFATSGPENASSLDEKHVQIEGGRLYCEEDELPHDVVKVTLQTADGASSVMNLVKEGAEGCVRALKVLIKEKVGTPYYSQDIFLVDEGSQEGTPLPDGFELENNSMLLLCVKHPAGARFFLAKLAAVVAPIC